MKASKGEKELLINMLNHSLENFKKHSQEPTIEAKEIGDGKFEIKITESLSHYYKGDLLGKCSLIESLDIEGIDTKFYRKEVTKYLNL